MNNTQQEEMVKIELDAMDQIILDIEQEFADTYAHYGELPNIQQGLDAAEKAYKELWLESHSDDADQQYVKAMNVAVSALRIMHLLNEQEARRLCDVDTCEGHNQYEVITW